MCKSVNSSQKTKKKDLTELQKNENKEKSKKRIWVEHSISEMKRYRFFSDRLRNHDFDLYNDVIEICAGLWNFNLKN